MQVKEWNDKSKLMKDLVDQKLQLNDIEVHQVERVVEIALLCVKKEPKLRPPMDIVLPCLEEHAEMEDWITMNIKVNRNMNIDAVDEPLFNMRELSNSEGLEMQVQTR
jgi:hypothetical protein